jgi:proteic killer suppression protein
MIRGFRCDDTEELWKRREHRRWNSIKLPALRKLDQLAVALSLDTLRLPPGNKLEALKGTRKGQHSIRINDQWRVCFRWTPDGPIDVEMVDYH